MNNKQWEVFPDNQDYNRLLVGYIESHSNLLRVKAIIPDSDKEVFETADLITAAPDMLNALELVLITLDRIKPFKPFDSTQGIRDVINAAITKAKGKE